MNKSEALIRVVVAYVVALFVAGCTLVILDYGPLLNALIADIVATIVIYLFSRAYRNCSFIDAYWTVIPPFIVLYWIAVGASEVSTTRELLLFGLVLYWSTRLTLNWAYHWEGIHHEDWRYIDLRKKAPALGPLIDLFGIHLIPTLQVFLGLLPVYAVCCLGYRTFNWLDIVAALVTGAAITLQMLADFQLHRFIRTRQEGEYLATGLWAWSRHPNYLGELGFWSGLLLFGIAAMPSGWYWQMTGIAGMITVFLVFSIPAMEKRSLERRPGYQELMESVPMLFPLPWKAAHTGGEQ